MPRIYTAKYLLPGDAPLIIGGALLDVNGRISEVGPLEQVRRGNEQVEIVDYGDAVLLPTLVNVHTHLELTDFPRWSQSDPAPQRANNFVDWILEVIRVKHNVPSENYLPSLARGIELSIAAGTGAVGDIVSQLYARKAYQQSPLRGRIFLETLGQSRDYTSESYRAIEKALADGGVGLMDYGLAPHSTYTLSGDYLKQLYAACRERGLACTTHVAESPEEVEFLQSHGGGISDKLYAFVGWQQHLGKAPGVPPIEYLKSKGGLQPNNLLIHAVQLTATEIAAVAEAGCPVGLCPRSNARLDVGVAPVKKMLKAGITLALGTDSLASCESLSIWDELSFAARWFAGQVDAPTLLRMATCGGAHALGLGSELGRLQSGFRSSFQVLKAEALPGSAELIEFLVSHGRSAEVGQVCLDGSLLLPE